MNRIGTVIGLCLVCSLLNTGQATDAGPRPAAATFPDPTADYVIGGGRFTNPSGIAIGPHGRVFVVDYGGHRVLSWASVTQLLAAQAADLTLGGFGGAANQMNGPESVAIDAANRLYVADSGNHRVLVFSGALTTGMAAMWSFGSQGASNLLENRFQFPRGMALAPQGHLLLVDEFNNRVLVYRQPFLNPGAPDFTPDAQFTNLSAPRGVAVDGAGNVYITDSERDVVREYDTPLAGNATTISTPNLTLGTLDAAGIADCTNPPPAPAQTTQTTLACPIDIAIDNQGNVYVSDIYNHRVVAYENPATSRNTTPDALYGQATYGERLPNRGGAAGPNTLNIPLGMTLDSAGNLYMTDFENSRLLRFNAPAAPPGGAASITINAAGTPIDFNPARMLGTNTAVWLHPAGLANPTLIARTQALGQGLLRIPGGAWSQEYGGLSCELGANIPGAYPCKRFYEARPSDLIAFLKATGRQAIYTVNINATAKEAAALVAFFNANVNDATVIGIDANGTNWQTAGYWASLRAQRGHPAPFGITYWDFGNETYGGVAGSGPKCPAEGWEEVWTCDGTEYINGARGHEGYRQFRAAMRAIDPTIQLGVVGYDNPAGYTNWTNDVLAAGGDVIDFLTIHPYPYYFYPPDTPAGQAEMLALPQTQWSGTATALRNAIQTYAPGRTIPIWVTEFNLGNPAGDNDRQMTKALNGLYLADSIGQMIAHGYAVGLQWDLVGYTQPNGANMGLMNGDAGLNRQPIYYVYPLWWRFGAQMLPVTSAFNAATQLSVYAGRVDASTISLLAINKTGQAIDTTIAIQGAGGALNVTGGTVDVVRATSLGATSVTLNGITNPADDLANAPALPLASTGATVTYQVPAYSVVLLRMATNQAPPIGPSAGATTWYFAEGYTGDGFDEYLTLMNTGAAGTATISYFIEGQVSPVQRTIAVPAASRTSVAVHRPYDAATNPGGLGRYQVGHSTRIVSTVPIIAERPMYFTYNGSVRGVPGGHNVMGATAPARAWYFAEGYTGDGFDQYFTILNPTNALAPTTITYYLADGTTRTAQFTVDAASRFTVAVHDLAYGVGRGQAVSAKITTTNLDGIVVERPMYFIYNGSVRGVTGSHNVMGATAPTASWYFAEGYTAPGFDEYLTIMNPNATPAPVTLTYYLGGGQAPVVRQVTVPASSRYTVEVHGTTEGVGRVGDVATRVTTTNGGGIVVERPIYFVYNGSASVRNVPDGHIVMGATAPHTAWYFAEGYTGDGFDEYLTIMNPNATAAPVTLTYYLANGAAPVEKQITVPASARYSVVVHGTTEGVGRVGDVAVRVTTSNGGGIVVERPMYFIYYTGITGGHNVMGYAP